jgi:hypothetical protein
MNNWQKVINVGLAVIVTLLIYQNDKLNERINQLEDYKNGFIDETEHKKIIKEYCKNNADNENCLSREK